MEPRLRHRIARRARRQHGIVTREELLDLGLTTEAIDWALHSRYLVALFPGVYRVNGAPDTWRSRAFAAQRRVAGQVGRLARASAPAPLVAVAGEAAAHLHGLPGHARPPRVTLVSARRCRTAAVAVHRRVRLTDADVVTKDQIPTTSLAWTVVELAARSSQNGRSDVVAHVLGTGRLTIGQLLGPAMRTEALPGRTPLLRRLAELREGPHHVDHHRSMTERGLADACVEVGLPAPLLNHVVTTSGGTRHELDLAWLDEKLDVEVDGPHHLLPSQRTRDRARDRELRGDAWEVTRFPVEEIDEDPLGVARRVGRILERRRV